MIIVGSGLVLPCQVKREPTGRQLDLGAPREPKDAPSSQLQEMHSVMRDINDIPSTT